MAVITKIVGKNMAPVGVAPSVVLINPKYSHNVGMVLRNLAAFGWEQLWYTGDRIKLSSKKGKRLPREERMKVYDPVAVYNYDYPFDMFQGSVTPVAVEISDSAEPLHDFVHPGNAIYVFGPEDGGLNRMVKQHCHRFVTIPSRHCFNLAVAVAMVMYDRTYKNWFYGTMPWPTLAENRGFMEGLSELYGVESDRNGD